MLVQLTRRLLVVFCLCVFYLTPAQSSKAQSAITPKAPASHTQAVAREIFYVLTPVLNQEPRRLDVTMILSVPEGAKKVQVQMPVWSPGDYAIQNHAQCLQNLKAVGQTPERESAALAVTHPDANTWEIASGRFGRVDITYSIPTTANRQFQRQCDRKAELPVCQRPCRVPLSRRT